MTGRSTAFTAGTLLTTLWRRKVDLRAYNGDLIIRPASALTAPITLALIEHKPVILAALRRAGPTREITLDHLVAAQKDVGRWSR